MDHKVTESMLVKAFTDKPFIAYGKLIKAKWTDESVDTYTNNISWLAGLAEFIGRSMKKIVKLAFVHGFPDRISITLQHMPQVEIKEMSELITAARELIINRTEKSRGIEAVAQIQTNSEPGTKQSSRFIGQCFWCSGPYMLKDCKEWPMPPVTCYGCEEKTHIVRFCSQGNRQEGVSIWMMGDNTIIDLKSAYLQLHVAERVWQYQLVMYKGTIYCLTRLGFGLNIIPKTMTKWVVKHSSWFW